MRRMMYRISAIIANENKCNILVNGESIGQVASQTLTSMRAINEVVKMPVIRPVACFDKLEIIKEPIMKLIDFVVFKYLEDDYKSAQIFEANKKEFKKLQEKYNYPKVIEEMKRQIDFREKTCS